MEAGRDDGRVEGVGDMGEWRWAWVVEVVVVVVNGRSGGEGC